MNETPSGLVALLASPPDLTTFLVAGTGLLLLVSAGSFAVRTSKGGAGLRRLFDRLVQTLVAIVLLAMVFFSALQIFLRNAFESGWLWIDPLLRHCVVLLTLLGGIVATGRKRHIQVNLLERFLSGGAHRIVSALIAGLSGVVSLLVAHASLLLIRDELAVAELAFLGIPHWMLLCALPVGFFCIALRFFVLIPLEIAGEAPQGGEAEALVSAPAGVSS